MRLYRITKLQYMEDYSGRGASYLHGGRWNTPGLPVLYFAQTPAVAMLEMAHYIPTPRLVPKSFRLGEYEVPESISQEWLKTQDYPQDWNANVYPKSTQQIGGEWLRSASSLILWVPSTALPIDTDKIAVVNPLHPEINQLKLISSEQKIYNERAFRGVH